MRNLNPWPWIEAHRWARVAVAILALMLLAAGLFFVMLAWSPLVYLMGSLVVFAVAAVIAFVAVAWADDPEFFAEGVDAEG